MNIWNKVFLGVIFLAAIAVLALAAVEMRIRSTGQKHIDSLTRKIEETDASIAKIVAGTAPAKNMLDKSQNEWSFEGFRNALRERYYERGRAWFGCIASNPNEETLPPALQQVVVQVTITGPFAPSETGTETEVVRPDHLRGVVYVFEEGAEGDAGTFLGRFNVDSEPTTRQFQDDTLNEGNQFTAYQVTLITVDPLSSEEIDHIFDAVEVRKSRWAIYLTPPVDRIAGIFSQLTEEERQVIPAEVLERFQPRTLPELTEEETEGVSSDVQALWQRIREQMDDPEAESGEDYAGALDWFYGRLSTARRDIAIAQSDIAKFKVAEEAANAENKKLEADGDRGEKYVEAMNVQRDAIKVQSEQYQEEINRTTLEIEKRQLLNVEYVAKIAEYQELATKTIEGRAAAPVRE